MVFKFARSRWGVEVEAASALRSMKEGRLSPTWPLRLAGPPARCSHSLKDGGGVRASTPSPLPNWFWREEDPRLLARKCHFTSCRLLISATGALSQGTVSVSSPKCHQSAPRRPHSRVFSQLVLSRDSEFRKRLSQARVRASGRGLSRTTQVSCVSGTPGAPS